MNLACFPLFLDDWYPSSLFRDLCRALALQKWDVRCSTPYPGHLRVELSFDQQAFRVWWYNIWFNPPWNQAASSTSGWLPVMVFRPTSSGTDSICIEDVLSRSSYIFYTYVYDLYIYLRWLDCELCLWNVRRGLKYSRWYSRLKQPSCTLAWGLLQFLQHWDGVHWGSPGWIWWCRGSRTTWPSLSHARTRKQYILWFVHDMIYDA